MTIDNLTFAACNALLVDSNVWITDSGATSDTTVHEVGISNNKKACQYY